MTNNLKNRKFTNPSSKADIGDEREDVAGTKIRKAKEGHDDHSRSWRHALDLDHGQYLRHLALKGTSVEEPARYGNYEQVGTGIAYNSGYGC